MCPYCGVGCQIDLEVRGNDIHARASPWIEETTPNIGSTCVKGRFGFDFAMHRDRLTKPLIRKGWVKRDGAVVVGAVRAEQAAKWGRRNGPWMIVARKRRRTSGARSSTRCRSFRCSTRRWAMRATAWRRRPSWYEPFREATLGRGARSRGHSRCCKLRDTHGPDSLAVFSSAKCTQRGELRLHAAAARRDSARTTSTTAPGSATRPR